MLLTHARWAESNPVKKRLSAPHRPWRCVGLTADSPIFLIDLSSDDHPDNSIRSVLVASPEELIDIVAEVGPQRCRVYHLGRPNGSLEARPSLIEVKSLMSHRAPDNPVKSYVYADAQGAQHNCFSWAPRAGEGSVWEEELALRTPAS